MLGTYYTNEAPHITFDQFQKNTFLLVFNLTSSLEIGNIIQSPLISGNLRLRIRFNRGTVTELLAIVMSQSRYTIETEFQ